MRGGLRLLLAHVDGVGHDVTDALVLLLRLVVRLGSGGGGRGLTVDDRLGVSLGLLGLLRLGGGGA